jgi:hypothetical protein
LNPGSVAFWSNLNGPLERLFAPFALVTCPVALYPATSDSEKISFNQINRNTGHRIKYMKVDADTGEEVSNDDIIKGYKVDTDTYVEVSKDELENIALESNRTIGRWKMAEKSCYGRLLSEGGALQATHSWTNADIPTLTGSSYSVPRTHMRSPATMRTAF